MNENFLNYNIFPSFIIGLILCLSGDYLARKTFSAKQNLGIILLCAFLFLISFSFVFYYFHLIENSIFYLEFRAFPHSEILISLAGIPLGFFTRKYIIKNHNILIMSILLSVGIILIPYIKPILRPITFPLKDDWQEEVCIQSCGATCGPSSLATIYRYHGMEKTEQLIAEKSHSCASGTEIWYLIRFARANGLLVKCKKISSLEDVVIPAILGTTLGGNIGHFVTLLGKEGNEYVIGDPLKGRVKFTEKEFLAAYKLENIAFEIENAKALHIP